MIILNEKAYAENCLKNKEIDQNNPFLSLSIIAKYYYHSLGYRKKKIEQCLTEIAENSIISKKYTRSMWENYIEQIAKNAGKSNLCEVDGVWITSKELETIKQINDAVLERLAFTLLCIAKFNNIRNPNNTGWVNNSAKEIFNLARISCTVKERYMNLGSLGSLGLLEYPKRIENLSVRVTYIDPDGEKVLFVSDFRELGYEYMNYCGGNFTRCCECGKLFRSRKNGSIRYCRNCIGYKTITCVDCGKEFRVSTMNNQTNRCNSCQTLRNNELSKERMRKYRSADS